MHKKYSLLIVLILILSGLRLTGQIGLNLPYSAKGIGYLHRSYNISNMSMGGISIGIRDGAIVNVNNPASLTAIDTVSFVFEGGFFTRYTSLKTNLYSAENATASLTHLLFGFPVAGWWKSSFGLLPFSQVGYAITEKGIYENIGAVQHKYEGSGGLSRLFWANGFSIGRHLSAGFNASYLFGTIDKSQSVTFPDSIYMLNTKVNNLYHVGNLWLVFGIQGRFALQSGIILNTGLTYSKTSDLNVKRDYLSRSFLGTIRNIEVFKDTIHFAAGEKGKLTLPGVIGAGFSIEQKDKWLIGIDFEYEKWSDFALFQIADQYEDRYRIMVGGRFSPDKVNGIRYYEKIDYRAGFYYGKSNLSIRGNHLNEFGITFGLGLPLVKSNSMLNFAIHTGRTGKTADNLIQESFIVFSAGVSVKEFWFFKRKYF